MSQYQRLSTGEIQVGKALTWPVYDANGVMLLKKGMIISSDRQMQILLNRGLYINPSDAVNDELPPEKENRTSPFTCLADFSKRLEQAFLDIQNKNPDSEKHVLRLAKNIQDLCSQDADALIGAVHLDHGSNYTSSHPIHVAILCEIFSVSLEVPEQQRLDMICAALTANISIIELQTTLHDQAGPMSTQQKQDMDVHPIKSVEMLEAAGISNTMWLRTIEQHHERNDGNGYPNGISGNNIFREAKLIALCDIYSAMVVAKSYRDAHPANDILRVLFINKGKELDEELCLQIIKIMGVFPPGSFVKLENAETCVVTKRALNGVMWPTVASILDSGGKPYDQPIKRNCNDDGFKIKEMVSLDKKIPLNLHHLWNYF